MGKSCQRLASYVQLLPCVAMQQYLRAAFLSNCPSRFLGFTSVELLVTLAVVSILSSLAAINFSVVIHRYNVKSICDELMASVQWARSEAIRRGFSVILVRTTGCAIKLQDSSDWSCGWRAVVDTNMNGAADNTEPIIQVNSIIHSYGIKYPAQGSQLLLNRWGQAQGVGSKFVVAPLNDITGKTVTALCISSGGRLRAIQGKDHCT